MHVFWNEMLYVVDGICYHIKILFIFICRKLRTKSTTPTLINICVCLALVYIFFVFGIGLTADKTVCDAMTFLLHYFTLASLSWMTVNAYQMYRSFTNVGILERHWSLSNLFVVYHFKLALL